MAHGPRPGMTPWSAQRALRDPDRRPLLTTLKRLSEPSPRPPRRTTSASPSTSWRRPTPGEDERRLNGACRAGSGTIAHYVHYSTQVTGAFDAWRRRVQHARTEIPMRPLHSATLALLLGLGLTVSAAPSASHAQASVGVSVGYAPPPLPIYEQPPIPGYGYLWTPGYWAWDDYDGDYYWVPGTWVLPPRIGYLWTPGYWDFVDGYYVFNDGYWGPEVGFYGDINYGFGYFGYGYEGGYWRGRDFFYNRSVNNVRNVSVTNVFSRPMVNNGGLSSN